MVRSSLLLLLGLSACATTSVTRAPPVAPVAPDGRAPQDRWAAWPGEKAAAPTVTLGPAIATRAAKLAGLASLRQVTGRLPDDCTGVARFAYQAAGVELMGDGRRGDNGVTAIHRKAERLGALHRKTPQPGDLVFFRETYDRNRDGKRNDGLTHVGVVEQVEPSGTVVFVHRGGQGVARARLTVAAPAVRTAEDGTVLNDFIRARSRQSRAYLTGELFAGYASARALAAPPAVAMFR